MKTLICKLPSLQTKQVPHREVIVGDLVIVHWGGLSSTSTPVYPSLQRLTGLTASQDEQAFYSSR